MTNGSAAPTENDAADGEAKCRDKDRSCHGEGEAWVPVPGENEEVEDLCRVDHARDGQSQAKQKSGQEGCEQRQDVSLQRHGGR